MQFYTTNQLSNNQQLTPEGYLLCGNCPIARSGNQTYAHGEIPVESNDSGLIFIDRPEAEVFRPETIASFNGKPIVDEHPQDGKVGPDNWNEKTVGVVLNPRRGDGAMFDRDFLYADLLITNRDAIQAVRDGKREVSCGYDAEYQQLAPGQGRQHNIIGNHVALVDRGRCGPQCAIGDEAVATNKRFAVSSFRRRLRSAIRTGDEAAVLNAVAELEKDPEIMGEVLSGDDLSDVVGGKPNDLEGHHVTINVHGAGSKSGTSSEGAIDAGEAVTPPIAGNPSPKPPGAKPAVAPAGGAEMPPWAQAIMQRLDTLEQVVTMLADDGGEGGDNPDAGGGNGGGEGGDNWQAGGMDRRGGARDEEGGYGPDADRDPPNKFNEDRRRRTGDSARATTKDSTGMRPGFVTMMSQAEILMPGIALPTFDSASPAKMTLDAMCNFKRRTLDASYNTEAGKAAIDAVLGDKPKPKAFLDAAAFSCDAVSMVFNGAATVMGQHNTRLAQSVRFGSSGQPNGFSPVPNAADINTRNAEFWAKHGGVR